MSPRFNIGDKVKIRSDSMYYANQNRPGPAVVISNTYDTGAGEESHIYRVKFLDGETNNYREKDLRWAGDMLDDSL